MNLFRSGEHIERWLAGREPGVTISVQKLSELAHAWWEAPIVPRGTRGIALGLARPGYAAPRRRRM